MKANNGKGNIQERDLWETPNMLFSVLSKQYHFSYDCCANHKNTKCLSYSNNFKDVMCINNKYTCWINPPFSKSYEMFSHFFKVVKKGVGIYRCDNMETKVWQDIIFKNACWIFIPKGRINYQNLKGSGSRFPSALIGYNVEPPINIKGILLEVKE